MNVPFENWLKDRQRDQADEKRLAEIWAADGNADSPLPSAGELAARFQHAVYNGFTKTAADTLKKGGVVPDELVTTLDFGTEKKTVIRDAPMMVAVRNQWEDMVKLLAPVVNGRNLEEGLEMAEFDHNVPVARIIRDEIMSRNRKAAGLGGPVMP